LDSEICIAFSNDLLELQLDIHWRPADFPSDAFAAVTYVQNLAGPHGMTVEITDLVAEQTTFQDRPAWYVKGQWKEPEVGVARPGTSHCPAEWLIFECPESDWLWTLLITANKGVNMEKLRTLRGMFKCPTLE